MAAGGVAAAAAEVVEDGSRSLGSVGFDVDGIAVEVEVGR
jgi:hypothetical protein